MERTQNRVWEIDAVRGLLILLVLINHLNITVNAFCIHGYYKIDSEVWAAAVDPLRIWFRAGADGVLQSAQWVTTVRGMFTYPAVDLFFVVSGISCAFSRNNVKRGLKTLGAGVFVAAFTYGLAIWTGDPTRFIRFGVLPCYAFCQLIYAYLLGDKSNETLFFIAAPVLALGYYLRYHGVPATRLPLFYIFGVPQIGDQSSDFWPVFPMLGWFLMGVVIGRKYYGGKKSLFPKTKLKVITRPLQWMGRHSGIIYVSHIVVYTAVFCGVGYLLGIL